MKVLLTGANGFVGSHVLDRLVESEHEPIVMLRRSSNTRFIESYLERVEVRYGSLESADSLRAAFEGAQVVIHCAGKTKVLRRADYYAANAGGALHVAEACNACAGTVRQLVLISSQAVSGPGTPDAPAREDAPPRPLSHYARSKARGERHVRERCRVPWTILRPAAVYGPRDGDFLLLWRAAGGRVVPLVGGAQPLSLIYAPDLAEAVLRCIGLERSFGGVYHVAHPAPCTQEELVRSLAAAQGRRPLLLPLPGLVLYPVCAARGLWARITRRPTILNLDKVAEYRAPGWVCDTSRAREDIGFVAPTPLDEGVRSTLDWYREHGWL